MLSAIAALSVLAFMAALAVSGLVPQAAAAAHTAGMAARALRDPEMDDDARERAAQQASLSLLRAFFGLLWRTGAILAAAFVPILLAAVLGLEPVEASVDFLSRWDVLLITAVAGTLIWIGAARLAGPAAPGYSATDRILHRMALSGQALPEVLHDVERGMFLRKASEAQDGAHVFVCGLARAGTTVLTRDLHDSGAFGSLTYRDMPFVLAPNLWKGFASQSKVARQERAHGDGLDVDLDSPEALDEVYWRMTCGAEYIRGDRLVPHDPDAGIRDGYADYLRLILLRCGKARYLSKNNNNILRVKALVDTFPNAQVLIPVRAPGDHAASLMRQHARFRDASGFEADYVRWLGHHEFGATHLPFAFAGRPQGAPDEPDYWLRMWLGVYGALEPLAAHPRVRFVRHERLAGEPGYRDALLASLGVEAAAAAELRPVRPGALPAFDPDLIAAAEALLARLDPPAV